jgi:CBS domain containing-hemolysin-like protein
MEFGNVYILPAGSYDMYITSIHIDPSEVFERFRSTQVYYERDITEPSTGTLPERLDNWLGSIGLNNTFFKILLSVVLMTVVAISLALMHAPASVVIFGTVLVLALVAFFGWVPLWIIIMVALLLLLTTIFKLKGAGGGSAEDD